jgi:hypothetical protein
MMGRSDRFVAVDSDPKMWEDTNLFKIAEWTGQDEEDTCLKELISQLKELNSLSS